MSVLKISNGFFDEENLLKIAASLHTKFKSARPFRHIIIDNALPEEKLNAVIDEFPERNSSIWKEFNHEHSRKLQSKSDAQFPCKTRQLLDELNSSRFLHFLEELTSIKGLIPDPYYEGAGLHNIERGGKLGIHADFNYYEKLGLCRQLNLLLYLNKDWNEEYGGNLELWDEGMTECKEKILPIFNRMVIFKTDDTSFHGHPDPLTPPVGISRKSIALYYYTVCDNDQVNKHSTLYKDRPRDKLKARLSKIVRLLTPPVIVYSMRWLYKKIISR